jgi:Tfp pilus assembly protein FimT
MEFPCKLALDEKEKLAAFSLVELLISISIIALMSALSIAAYPKFSAQLSVASESYRLLGFLRETQAYGVSSYAKPGEKTIYGILVDKDTNTIKRMVASTDRLVTGVLRADSKFKNSDFINSATDFIPEGDQDVAATFENPKFKIVAICSSEECNPDQSTVNRGYALYKRPNPEARLVLVSGSLLDPSPTEGDTGSLAKMVIFLEHPLRKEMRKKVILLRTGQMYVEEW